MSVWREAHERVRSLVNSPANATLRRLTDTVWRDGRERVRSLLNSPANATLRRLTDTVWRQVRERLHPLLNSPSNAILRRLLTDQGSKHWKGYVFAFAMMGLIALTTSLSAWIIGQIVNKIFVGRDLNAVWEITAAIVIIYTVKGLATYGQQVSLSRIGNSIVADVQRRIFDQMLRMRVSYYSRSHSSEFIARQAFIAQSASNVLNLLITTDRKSVG